MQPRSSKRLTKHAIANPVQIQQFNFAYNAIDATVEAMRRHEPSFSLPVDFFDHEVIAVPAKKGPAPLHKASAPLPHCGSETTGAGPAAVEIS